jgi:CRISPR/Cas system-associated exonuclease Cas4 (RecB family)
MRCPGSLRLEAEMPDKPSRYAAEGTLAHSMAADYLENKPNPQDYLGGVNEEDGFDFIVDQAMIDYVVDYAKLVREYAEGGELHIEQRLSFSDSIGVPDSFGTSDAVIVHPDRITIIDLKYGMGVRVDAQENEQLMLYALAALEKFGVAYDFKEVVMVIHQPRLNHVSEYAVPVEHIQAFAERAREAAKKALFDNDPTYEAGEKQCKFCKAKAVCPALKAEVDAMTADVATPADFADLVQGDGKDLAEALKRVAVIEQWCAAVREEAERRLVAGETVPGFKLVAGRKGNRKWTDEEAVEKLLHKSGIEYDAIFETKLASPTKIEKLLKSNSVLLDDVMKHTVRPDGKPSVVYATDQRPEKAAVNIADALRDLNAK